MLRERGRTVDAVLRVLDLAALTVAFPVAYLVRDGLFGERIGWPGLYPFQSYRYLLVLTLLAWIAASSLLRLYRAHRLPTIRTEVLHAGGTLLVVAAAMGAAGFLAKQGSVSRLFVGFWFAVAMGFLVATRLLVRVALRALRRWGYKTRIFAVVGTGDVAHQVGEGIRARREWGYHLAGFIEEDEQPRAGLVGPLLGPLSKLEQFLGYHILDEIIFAVPQERLSKIEAAVQLCRKHGVTARICLDGYPAGSDVTVEEVNGVPLLGFSRR